MRVCVKNYMHRTSDMHVQHIDKSPLAGGGGGGVGAGDKDER